MNDKQLIPTEYTETGISKIEEVGLLAPEDFAKLSTVREGVLESWKNTQIWRSEADAKYSVLNDTKFPTIAHKYLQCQKEQDVHFRQLMYLSTDFEEKKGELMYLGAELEELESLKPKGVLEAKKIKAKIIGKKAVIQRNKWNLIEMEKAGHHRVREVAMWDKIKGELSEMEEFDPTNIDGILKESYQKRWTIQRDAHLASDKPDGDRVAILQGSLNAAKNYDNNIRKTS